MNFENDLGRFTKSPNGGKEGDYILGKIQPTKIIESILKFEEEAENIKKKVLYSKPPEWQKLSELTKVKPTELEKNVITGSKKPPNKDLIKRDINPIKNPEKIKRSESCISPTASQNPKSYNTIMKSNNPNTLLDLLEKTGNSPNKDDDKGYSTSSGIGTSGVNGIGTSGVNGIGYTLESIAPKKENEKTSEYIRRIYSTKPQTASSSGNTSLDYKGEYTKNLNDYTISKKVDYETKLSFSKKTEKEVKIMTEEFDMRKKKIEDSIKTLQQNQQESRMNYLKFKGEKIFKSLNMFIKKELHVIKYSSFQQIKLYYSAYMMHFVKIKAILKKRKLAVIFRALRDCCLELAREKALNDLKAKKQEREQYEKSCAFYEFTLQRKAFEGLINYQKEIQDAKDKKKSILFQGTSTKTKEKVAGFLEKLKKNLEETDAKLPTPVSVISSNQTQTQTQTQTQAQASIKTQTQTQIQASAIVKPKVENRTNEEELLVEELREEAKNITDNRDQNGELSILKTIGKAIQDGSMPCSEIGHEDASFEIDEQSLAEYNNDFEELTLTSSQKSEARDQSETQNTHSVNKDPIEQNQQSKDPKQLKKPAKLSMKEIEERRKERKEKALLIKQKHEEARLKKEKEQQLLKEKQLEEEKKRKKEERRKLEEKRKAEMDAQIRKEEENKRYQEKLANASKFALLAIKKWYGMVPWKKLISTRRMEIDKAKSYCDRKYLKRFVMLWKKGLEMIRFEEQEKFLAKLCLAEKKHNKTLEIKAFYSIINYYELAKEENITLAEIRQNFLIKNSFCKWHELIPQLKVENFEIEKNYSEMITKFRFLTIGEKVIRSWKAIIDQEKKERLIEQNKKAMWNKVNGWLAELKDKKSTK